eukprot:489669-Pelagomonas_calceolata.AAC.4
MLAFCDAQQHPALQPLMLAFCDAQQRPALQPLMLALPCTAAPCIAAAGVDLAMHSSALLKERRRFHSYACLQGQLSTPGPAPRARMPCKPLDLRSKCMSESQTLQSGDNLAMPCSSSCTHAARAIASNMHK